MHMQVGIAASLRPLLHLPVSNNMVLPRCRSTHYEIPS